MKDVGKNGRTVLFVSHNMAAIKSLCDRAILLENGLLKYDGSTAVAINKHVKGDGEINTAVEFKNKYLRKEFKLHKIEISSIGKSKLDPLEENDTLELLTTIELFEDQANRYSATYHLINEIGEAVFSFSNEYHNEATFKKGMNYLTCSFPKGFFQSGTFYLSFYLVKDKKASIFNEKDIFSFTIVDSPREIGVFMGREPGFIRPTFNWTLKND